jgi:hypothetical protein
MSSHSLRSRYALALALSVSAIWPTCASAQDFTAQVLRDPDAHDDANLASPKTAPNSPAGKRSTIKPKAVITIFEQACMRTTGQSAQAVDWALAHEFVPVETQRSATEDTMLGGEPGTVLVAPHTDGRVMLAVALNQCTVWAERIPGPPIRQAVSNMVLDKYVKAQRLIDRSVERAGMWRNQMKWRYRPAGADQDWSLGLITTLANSPGTQVLRWAPLVAGK